MTGVKTHCMLNAVGLLLFRYPVRREKQRFCDILHGFNRNGILNFTYISYNVPVRKNNKERREFTTGKKKCGIKEEMK